MNTTKKTLFISDLHLEESRPAITSLFLDFLKQCDGSVDALYILGDLFEAWIGDDDDSPFHRHIITALHTASQKGLRLYFLYGNRDFLIGKKFLQETGCQLLADEEKISLYGTSVLVMHGDTLCTGDVHYLKWRKISRSRLFKTILLTFFSLRSRKKIAEKIRATSQQHTSKTKKEIMDVTQTEVERVMQQHQVQFLIHGHTHRPGTHTFPLNQQISTRIVLDAWHNHGSVLVWNSNGEKELLTLPLTASAACS